MALTVTLEFSEDELDYFRSLMHRVRDRNGQRPQHEVAAAAVAFERVVNPAHTGAEKRQRVGLVEPDVERRVGRLVQAALDRRVDRIFVGR